MRTFIAFFLFAAIATCQGKNDIGNFLVQANAVNKKLTLC